MRYLLVYNCFIYFIDRGYAGLLFLALHVNSGKARSFCLRNRMHMGKYFILAGRSFFVYLLFNSLIPSHVLFAYTTFL